MPSKWRRLCLQQGLPPLLFQYSWTRHGYELYMTDLSHIWSEQLSHKEILKRAEDDEVTIDPSEDTEQFQVLLEKIGEGLRDSDGTHATLNSGAHADLLKMTTTTKLPAPLKPLKWSFYLPKQPPSSSTDHLLLPLLREEADWETRQRFLLEQLKQKDWVLSKLFDKIETIGVDLGTVFPGVAGLRTARKGMTLSEAAKFVKGAAPFDAPAWLEEIRGSSHETSGLAANLLQEISASDSISHLESLKPPQDKWWNNLLARPEPSTAKGLATEQERNDKIHDELPRSTSKKPQPQAAKDDIETDDVTKAGSEADEFERQETPPALKPKDAHATESPPKAKTTKRKSPSPRALSTEADEATATESEPEAASATRSPRKRTQSKSPAEKPAPLPPAQYQEPPKKPRGGLGVIGGKKKKEKEQPPPPAPAPAPTSPQIPSKPVELPAHDHSPVSAPSPTAPPTKKPTKLGMIGGKAKAKAKPSTTPTKPTVSTQGLALPASSPPELVSPTRPTKADQDDEPDLDKKFDTDEVHPLASRSTRVPEQPTTVPVPAPPAPETEEARADRKREELKRQLEAKSMAPAKRKRRF